MHRFVALLAAAASVAVASPAPVPVWVDPRMSKPISDLIVHDPNDFARDPEHFQKRLSGEFDLTRSWNNDVLFDGRWAGGSGSDSEKIDLTVTCVECWTKGTVQASLTTEDIFEPVVRLDLFDVEAYVDIAVSTTDTATYTVTLYSSDGPVGLSLPGLSIGVVLYLDLVFSVTAEIDLEGGFYVTMGEDAFLETNIFDGEITDTLFDGISSKSIPVTLHSGQATLKADLRLRVQCGASADLDILDIGAGAAVGVYANLLEFVTVLDHTPECDVRAQEWFDLNVGASASIGIDLPFESASLVPSVSTTLFRSPTFTQCWGEHSPAESGGSNGSPLPGLSSATGHTRTADTVAPVPTASVTMSKSTAMSSITAVASTEHPSASVTSKSTPIRSHSHSWSMGNNSTMASTASQTTTPGSLVTSTIYSTTEYTITKCAATVVNCPASMQSHIVVTKTIDAFTTVCPFGASVTIPTPKPTSSAASPGKKPEVSVNIITEELVVLKKIKPEVCTFTGTESAHIGTATVTVPAVSQTMSSHVTYTFSNGTSTAPATTVKPTGTGVLTSPGMVSQTATPLPGAGTRVYHLGYTGVAIVCAVVMFSLEVL